jgi:hypothetical protein
MKSFINNTKRLLLKLVISTGIFLSFMVIGTTGIFAINSLDEAKSTASPTNQLTATKWDYVVDQVKGIGNDLDVTIAKIRNITGQITAINTTLSGVVSSQRENNGNNIYYTKGNVGIKIDTSNYPLHVNGNASIKKLGINGNPQTNYELYVNGAMYIDSATPYSLVVK